jgi:hypothetical protein
MFFVVPVRPGSEPIWRIDLHYATQIDTIQQPACDFMSVPLLPLGSTYFGAVRLGAAQSCGPLTTADNLIYYASARDVAGYTISSKVYRGGSELTFSPDFAPVLEHFPHDNFPSPPAPDRCSLPVP